MSLYCLKKFLFATWYILFGWHVQTHSHSRILEIRNWRETRFPKFPECTKKLTECSQKYQKRVLGVLLYFDWRLGFKAIYMYIKLLIRSVDKNCKHARVIQYLKLTSALCVMRMPLYSSPWNRNNNFTYQNQTAFFGETPLLLESTNSLCSLWKCVFKTCIFFSISTAAFSHRIIRITFLVTVFVLRCLTSHKQGNECISSMSVKVFSLFHILCICLVCNARWTDVVFANCILFFIYNRRQETRNTKHLFVDCDRTYRQRSRNTNSSFLPTSYMHYLPITCADLY